MNLFKLACKEQWRFQSPKMILNVEQVCQLPLKTTSGMDLDTVAKLIAKGIAEAGTESFVSVPSETTKTLQYQLELVKEIIKDKVEEQQRKANEAKTRQEIEVLTDLLAKKQLEKKMELSEEELLKKIEELKSVV